MQKKSQHTHRKKRGHERNPLGEEKEQKWHLMAEKALYEAAIARHNANECRRIIEKEREMKKEALLKMQEESGIPGDPS